MGSVRGVSEGISGAIQRWTLLAIRFRRSRVGGILFQVVIDFTAPVILTVLAVHELLYNGWAWQIWLLTFVLIWVLVARRRAPLLVLAVSLATVLALCVLGIDTVAFASLLVALYSVAAYRKFRWALLCTVVTEVAVYFVSQRFAPRGSVDDAVVLLSGLSLAALFLGTTLQGKRGYLASVEDRAARLEREQAQQAELAALAERARIAREMHDIVAHGLSVVITLAEGAAATADPVTSRRAMQQVAQGGRQSLAEMRKLLDVLRSETGGSLAPQPTLETLESLVEDVRRTGLDVELDILGDASAPSEATQATLYRIVQEALTNVLKHARRASRVTVRLAFSSEVAEFAIQDDGAAGRRRTGNWSSSGNGITGMRERVAMYGGTLETGRNDTGWLVRGELQLI